MTTERTQHVTIEFDLRETCSSEIDMVTTFTLRLFREPGEAWEVADADILSVKRYIGNVEYNGTMHTDSIAAERAPLLLQIEAILSDDPAAWRRMQDQASEEFEESKWNR